MSKEAMKLALGFAIMHHTDAGYTEVRYAVQSALREALAEQPAQQEPPAWWPAVENILKEYGLQAIDFVADFKAALANTQTTDKCTCNCLPLTDEKIEQLASKHLDVGDGPYATHFVTGSVEFVRAIEAAYGIKEST